MKASCRKFGRCERQKWKNSRARVGDFRALRISETSEEVGGTFRAWRYSERSRKGSGEDAADFDWRSLAASTMSSRRGRG